MFSFHKPKIYRSNLGCCICKAKSSSSRFTDSKKYETEFENCFRIQEKRSGEICNACVLLVKRWKKLSPENRLTKHWNHVVDARAGPGTKLTNGRRLTASNSNSSSASSAGSSASSATGSRAHDHESTSGNSKRRSDVLPLSSSQANNQTPSGSSNSNSSSEKNERSSGKRFSVNKARAIDTNVSTFTFGEPIRRNYMLTESTGYTTSYSSSSSIAFSKPQSALNSSAFELVIKRFRQRQQQQQLEAQRRQLNRKQKLQQQSSDQKPAEAEAEISKETSKSRLSERKEEVKVNDEQSKQLLTLPVAVSKRVKRSSECIGSLSVDGLRVSSLLDATIWRKERICCGIIFRGLNNEVAVFPKLLKPCQCRIKKLKQERDEQSLIESAFSSSVAEDQEESSMQRNLIKPRAIKSGSVSSYDSNTSGTGSMEQPIQDLTGSEKQQQHLLPDTKRQRRSGKTALITKQQLTEVSSQNNRKQLLRRRAANNVAKDGAKRLSAQTTIVTSGRSRGTETRKQLDQDSPSSSSETSSSRLYLMEDDDGDEMEIDDVEDDDDDDDDGEEEEEEGEFEEENDDEDEDDDEEEEEEEEELSLESLEDEEQITSNPTDSGMKNLSNIERKKSTVGAIG